MRWLQCQPASEIGYPTWSTRYLRLGSHLYLRSPRVVLDVTIAGNTRDTSCRFAFDWSVEGLREVHGWAGSIFALPGRVWHGACLKREESSKEETPRASEPRNEVDSMSIVTRVEY